MSVPVELPDDLVARLQAEATARGVGVEVVAAEAITEHFSPRRRLRFAGVGTSTGGRGAAEAEELLAEGGFGIDRADH